MTRRATVDVRLLRRSAPDRIKLPGEAPIKVIEVPEY